MAECGTETRVTSGLEHESTDTVLQSETLVSNKLMPCTGKTSNALGPASSAEMKDWSNFGVCLPNLSSKNMPSHLQQSFRGWHGDWNGTMNLNYGPWYMPPNAYVNAGGGCVTSYCGRCPWGNCICGAEKQQPRGMQYPSYPPGYRAEMVQGAQQSFCYVPSYQEGDMPNYMTEQSWDKSQVYPTQNEMPKREERQRTSSCGSGQKGIGKKRVKQLLQSSSSSTIPATKLIADAAELPHVQGIRWSSKYLRFEVQFSNSTTSFSAKTAGVNCAFQKARNWLREKKDDPFIASEKVGRRRATAASKMERASAAVDGSAVENHRRRPKAVAWGPGLGGWNRSWSRGGAESRQPRLKDSGRGIKPNEGRVNLVAPTGKCGNSLIKSRYHRTNDKLGSGNLLLPLSEQNSISEIAKSVGDLDSCVKEKILSQQGEGVYVGDSDSQQRIFGLSKEQHFSLVNTLPKNVHADSPTGGGIAPKVRRKGRYSAKVAENESSPCGVPEKSRIASSPGEEFGVAKHRHEMHAPKAYWGGSSKSGLSSLDEISIAKLSNFVIPTSLDDSWINLEVSSSDSLYWYLKSASCNSSASVSSEHGSIACKALSSRSVKSESAAGYCSSVDKTDFPRSRTRENQDKLLWGCEDVGWRGGRGAMEVSGGSGGAWESTPVWSDQHSSVMEKPALGVWSVISLEGMPKIGVDQKAGGGAEDAVLYSLSGTGDSGECLGERARMSASDSAREEATLPSLGESVSGGSFCENSSASSVSSSCESGVRVKPFVQQALSVCVERACKDEPCASISGVSMSGVELGESGDGGSLEPENGVGDFGKYVSGRSLVDGASAVEGCRDMDSAEPISGMMGKRGFQESVLSFVSDHGQSQHGGDSCKTLHCESLLSSPVEEGLSCESHMKPLTQIKSVIEKEYTLLSSSKRLGTQIEDIILKRLCLLLCLDDLASVCKASIVDVERQGVHLDNIDFHAKQVIQSGDSVRLDPYLELFHSLIDANRLPSMLSLDSQLILLNGLCMASLVMQNSR